MSITFWMPQAPVMRVEPYPEEEPGYYTEEPVDPFLEINMSNSNFAAIMPIVYPGWDGDWCGKFSSDQCDSLYRRTFLALNKGKVTAALVEPTVTEGNITYCGRDMDYVTRRLTDFLKLFMAARDHGFEVRYG